MCLVSVVSLTGLLGASVLLAGPRTYKDGPPARVTGGFGEDSCHACHFDGEPNDPMGNLSILGVPERFETGESYPLRVILTRPKMAAGGFQLAVRFLENGEQAGSISPGSDEDGRMSVLTERGIEYIQHLLGGIEPTAPDTSSWTVLWTAPDSGGAVVFHAAAVAGDGDDSQIGDHVYTSEARTLHP